MTIEARRNDEIHEIAVNDDSLAALVKPQEDERAVGRSIGAGSPIVPEFARLVPQRLPVAYTRFTLP